MLRRDAAWPLGKHEEKLLFDVVKDKDGYLHGGNFWTGFGDDTKELAVRVRRLADAMEERGTKVGFVLPPMKVVRQQAAYTRIPYNDFTEQADSLLRWLRYYSVPYLDLRESLKRRQIFPMKKPITKQITTGVP